MTGDQSTRPSRLEAIELLVRLLAEIDEDSTMTAFYGRLCEALCRLTTMRRAVLFLYDDARHRVRAVGSHGVALASFEGAQVGLEVAPIAQRALANDTVVVANGEAENWVPGEYATAFGITTLTCVPLAAAGHWFGVVLADRGGGRFTVSAGERDTMWMLGKTAALAASARLATRQQDRARTLAERLDLARDIHERVMQRLFGVSLALSGEYPLTAEERSRCADELQAALGDLRSALQRPLAPASTPREVSLRDELERLRRRHDLPVRVAWDPGVTVPPAVEALATSVLAEALRNVARHAEPSTVDVQIGHRDGAFVLEVVNDGVREGRRGAGIGLRMAALEALQHGGVLEFGRADQDGWRVRLALPVE